MNITVAPKSTSDLIAAVSNELTPTERRIAQEVLSEPTLLAFGTVSDLAGRVGTSRPTIVRFANKLGFDGYTTLQRHVQNDFSHQLARPSERIRHGENKTPPARTAISGAIASVFSALEGGQLAKLAAPLVKAETVWVLSGETSQAGAQAFHSGLSMVRPGVRSLEEHSYGTDLSDATPNDAVIVFDFFRYRRKVTNAAQVFADTGASVVAITDSPLSPLVELADVWCEIEVPAVGPFDSSVPVVAIAELLVSRIARDLQDEATARIDQIEAIWEQTGVFI
ncbi:MAG: MurR/RpiR family transcriptional regulator [Xanthomonadales bacterium]|nr:MurR/RpiR family transcriptional regulator [Xanthomonadales bacterium]MDH4020481.1 MurR/RpiR family transcriptional regulator [Xanthomonadales bacterium]